MPFLDPIFRQRWFTWPNIAYAAPVPILVAISAFVLISGLAKRWDRAPFLAAVALFVLSYIGLGISFYPFIRPPSLTIWDAAAPASSLRFLLVGAVVLIPLILTYTAWSYWVFRGKISPDARYH
jgi:cytochrome d ubiquinol oxidase subunit II